MRICFDTDLICSIVTGSDLCVHAAICADIALVRDFGLCVCALSLPAFGQAALAADTEKDANARPEVLLDLLEVLDVTDADCRLAIREHGFDNFEAEVIGRCCARYGCDAIVSGDPQRFSSDTIAVLTPQAFIDAYTPSGYSYAEIEL